MNRSRIVDLGAIERAPSDQLVRDFVDDLRVPLDLRAGGTAHDPMRALLVDLLHGFDVVHELREIFEVAPEAVDAFRRRIDGHGLFDADAFAVRDAHLAAVVIFARGRDAHRLVHVAMPGRAAPHQCAAEAGDDEAGDRAHFETVCRDGAARDHGKPPLGLADIFLHAVECLFCHAHVRIMNRARTTIAAHADCTPRT
jgi:hypothetical protein